MGKRALTSSGARRALVVDYVNKGLVHSQSDLVSLLAEEGIEVTQATASRDLEEVGAVRGRDSAGVLRYRMQVGETEPRTRLARVSNELVLSITASGNLVVLKTPAGGAQLLASTLDRAATSGEVKDLIGTIAGDDTVLVVSRGATGGAALARRLREYIGAETAMVRSKSKASSRQRKGK